MTKYLINDYVYAGRNKARILKINDNGYLVIYLEGRKKGKTKNVWNNQINMDLKSIKKDIVTPCYFNKSKWNKYQTSIFYS